MTTLKTYLHNGGGDAVALLCYVLKKERAYLFAHGNQVLNNEQQQALTQLTQKRIQGVPLAYLTGEQGFYNLLFSVDKHTLIPRPETELLIDIAFDLLPDHKQHVLDLGTGSGAIAISLKHQRSTWQLTASDVNKNALTIAKQNAAKYHCNIYFQLSDWLTNISGKFDLIISNPPYIKTNDPHLKALRYENPLALVAGKDGLDAISHIAQHATKFLNNNGYLLLEHGYHQQDDVVNLLTAEFTDIQTFNDLNNIPRAVLARLK